MPNNAVQFVAENEIVLDVNTGYKTVRIRDGGEFIGEFKFNPTDSNILTRMENVIDFFNSVEFSDDMTEDQKFEATKELCQKICEQFDYLFGRKVSDGIFENCGPLSVTESGDFFFEDMLDKIGQIIESVMNVRVEKKLKKVREATKKYTT